MKRLLNKAIALALTAATWVGCVQEDYYLNTGQESESDIQVSLNLSIPDPVQAVTRAGVEEAIENMTVLCFDGQGLALTKIDLTPAASTDASGVFVPSNDDDDDDDYVVAGTLKVTIPNATRIMHVLANQEYSDQGTIIPFIEGMNENKLKDLVAPTNKMVYWARIEIPNGVTTKDWAEDGNPKVVSLLRNQAKVVVKNNNESEFTLSGFTVVNTASSGMAIPYDAKKGYPTSNDWIGNNYLHAINTNSLFVGADYANKEPIYVYETSVSSERPASIIIYGYNNSEPGNPKYWRVAFADAEGIPYNIRRNHRYTVNIEGHILGGYDTFALALAGDAIGIKPDIAPEVTAIKNSKFSLTVENTSYVKKYGTESLEFNFYIKQLGQEDFDIEKLSVVWDNGQKVKYDHTTTSDGVFTATVKETLKGWKSGDKGTITINYDERLERKIEIEVIPLQSFTINSYNGVEERTIVDEKFNFDLNAWDYNDEHYFMVVDESKPTIPIDRLKFSIPESFPNALYPFNVLISTNDLNAWDCPLIFPGDNRYGEDNGIGYKYVYRIDGLEDYYEVILRSIDRNLIAQEVELTLESEYFEPVTLHIIYPDYGN